MTQEAASEASGVHVRQIIRIEGGAVGPSFASLVALCVAYNVKPRDLFE